MWGCLTGQVHVGGLDVSALADRYIGVILSIEIASSAFTKLMFSEA